MMKKSCTIVLIAKVVFVRNFAKSMKMNILQREELRKMQVRRSVNSGL